MARLNGDKRRFSDTPHLVLISNSAWNVYNFRLGLVKSLMNAGYRVSVLATSDGYEKKLLSHQKKLVNFYSVPLEAHGKKIFDELRLLWSLSSKLKALRPDVILTFTIKPNIYGGLISRWLGVPYVATVSGLGMAFDSNILLRWIVSFLFRWTLKNFFGRKGASKILFQNEEDKNFFIHQGLVSAEKTLTVSGSGVDIDFWRPDKKRVKKKSFVFLMLCRLLWQKGVGEYVEAARLLIDKINRVDKENSALKNRNVKFQLLGILTGKRGEIIMSDIEQWQQDGIIEYLGYSDAPKKSKSFMQAADCMVLPTYYAEGVPRSLLEAASLGKPIIASHHTGCLDVVKHGVNGLLCRAKDANDLSVKMEHILMMSEPERLAMGRSGRQLIEKRFDEKKVFASYQEVLAQLF